MTARSVADAFAVRAGAPARGRCGDGVSSSSLCLSQRSFGAASAALKELSAQEPGLAGFL
ncbi:hypothetical protein CN934_18640 [Ensifer sp. MMN_5]|nr:hypothetical protein CN934_18640 [Ensifer sp. MMN_5]